MKKTIYNKFDKATINALPLVEYPHKINVILNEYEAERAVEYLLTCDILGVDTETKPAGCHARPMFLVSSQSFWNASVVNKVAFQSDGANGGTIMARRHNLASSTRRVYAWMVY